MARSALSRAIKLFGTDEPVTRPRTLTAGPISAVLDNGAIRYMRYRGVEVLRNIAFLVRDKNWGTYAPAIESLKVRQSKAGFSVSYKATCRDNDQAISYEAKIEANASGTLKFSAVGLPLSDFLTNRTGFVVLHPLAGVVGEPIEIVHTDDKREKSRFPKFISPGQPVFEIRSLKHTVMPGVVASVLMEGNKFEMEDHRNWMDASYKTYVCSLLDPWPYTLAEGKPCTQSITVTIEGKPAKKPSPRRGDAVAVSVGNVKGRLPICGTGIPMKEAQAALDRVDLLAAASPSHLICQIDGRETRQGDAADAFRRLKDKTGIPVRLEIILPAKDSAATEMAKIAEAVRQGGLKPDAVIVTQVHDLKSFQPGAKRPWGPTYEEMAAAARKEFPGTPLGGGMLSFFTELNRKRPPTGLFDFITHTVCPIVHAADDVSVMETLESLPSIFASAKAMIGTAPYHIGPSSIPCRDNPYGAAVAANPDNGRVCLSDADPRQRGLFAAAWSLFEAVPSVPMPTFRPRSSIRVTGAMPDASLRLLVGLCATPALASFSVRISPSSMCTQWAAMTLASNSRCFLIQGTTGIPCSRRQVSTSNAVSAMWIWSGTSNSAASSAQLRRISVVQVYGACGATAGTIRRCDFHSAMNSRA